MENTNTQFEQADVEVSSETKQVGNDLFQEIVVAPMRAAVAHMKLVGARVLTAAQTKAKAKSRTARKTRKASRRRNRA